MGVALAGCLTRSSAAQSGVKQITLKPANATLRQEFSSLLSLRELSDGRVLLTDPNDLGLVVADFRTNVVQPIGRKGRGPGEWEVASRLHAVSSDSTLLLQPASRRWLILHADRIAVTVPPDSPAIVQTQGLFYSADNRGFVVTARGTRPRPGVTRITERDSYAVVRVQRTTGHVDTIARVCRKESRLSPTTADA